MDAKDHPVISVLSDQKRFMVPIYQRQYSWRDNRLIPFWEDVVAKAEEALDTKPKFKHYMGALIIAPGADGYTVGVTPRVQVVDGQQRLTTFQLFLVGLREVASRLNYPEVAESVANYIFNRPMTGDIDPDSRFKLVPTPADKTVFHDIIDGTWSSVRAKYSEKFYNNGNLKWGQAPNTIRAFATFIQKIENYVRFGLYDPEVESPVDEDDGALQRKRLHSLLEALLNQLKLVVITLDESDDAQVIFETLNSKAEPLLAMDLVKNNIFHRAEAQGESAERLFDTKWRPFDALPFWKSDSPRARPQRPRIDHFLSHALTAQTGEEASLRELYAEYRGFARPKGQPRFATVEEELDALLRFAPIYQTLEEAAGDSPLALVGAKLATWEVTTAYPLIFAIGVAEVNDNIKAHLYELIYSYIVRRAICHLTPKNLNKNFQRLVALFLKHGVSLDVFAAAFADQTGPAVRFPADEEFRNAVLTMPVYENILKKERLADILWEFERKSRTKFSVDTKRPLGMSIEHILPRKWTTHWQLPDGRSAPDDKVTGADEVMIAAISERQSVLHTLGNLTLITVPANTVASNIAYPEKRSWLKQSLLALNLEILEHEKWDETEIAARAQTLAGLAMEIWQPLPQLFVSN